MPRVRRIAVEDVVRIARVDEVRLSSRGDLAFSAVVPDLERNRNSQEIRILYGGERLYLSGDGDSRPRWSPSGSRLAFISRRGAQKEEKGSGVYVWGMRGDPRRAAWLRDGASDLEWIGEEALAVLANAPVEGLHDPEGDFVASEGLPIWLDGKGLVASHRPQLHVAAPESGAVSRITDEKEGVLGFAVCGGWIYYFTRESWRRPHEHVVKRVRPGEDPQEVLRGLTISQLGCVAGEPHALAHRMSIGISSHRRLWRIYEGGAECLSCGLDRNVREISGELDGEPLVIYSDAGRAVLARVSRDGRVADVVREHGQVLTAHGLSGRVAYVYASPTEPPEVYTIAGGSRARASDLNQWLVREARLSPVIHEPFEIDGERIDGWVILPHGLEGKAPLILYIHGGPKGMYGYEFSPEKQLMAAEGFMVAYCNPRGSDGYSEDFADIRGRYGEDDYRQITAFLERVVEKYPVDRERIAVTGISYGGYMTNVLATRTGVFAAAVSENGIADWIADYWASDIGYWFDQDQIGGTPWDNLEGYVAKSPAFRIESTRTPLLLIHSVEDYRCFIDQALAMHVAYLSRGGESRLVIFTRGSHGHSASAEPRHRRRRLEIKISWLREKLLGQRPGQRRDPAAGPRAGFSA